LFNRLQKSFVHFALDKLLRRSEATRTHIAKQFAQTCKSPATTALMFLPSAMQKLKLSHKCIVVRAYKGKAVCLCFTALLPLKSGPFGLRISDYGLRKMFRPSPKLRKSLIFDKFSGDSPKAYAFANPLKIGSFVERLVGLKTQVSCILR
jgi:hypothetical protein